MTVKVKVKSLSHVWLFETPWTVTHQAPPPMEFSRQEYWSGLPFPSPRDLSDPGIEPRSPTSWADALMSEPPGNQEMNMKGFLFIIIIIFLNFTILYWFCHTLTWIRHGCTYVPHPDPPFPLRPHPIPQGHPRAPALNTLSHASSLDWRSVSHMIIYMFQWYSLRSSHPHLLPQSPKDSSIYLFCCLAYRVIITIFLNSICMHYYTVLVFFFLTYFTLYNRLQFLPPH